MPNLRDDANHRTVLVLREHDSVWTPEAKMEVLAYAHALHDALEQAGYTVVPVQIQSPTDLPAALSPFDPNECLILNWFEGIEPGATDGAQVVAKLDELGFIYTGSDAHAWRIAQNRRHAKRLLRAHAIPTPLWQPLTPETVDDWRIYPAIVKLADDHGSENLSDDSVVYDAAGLRAQMHRLHAEGIHELIVSEFVDGREFTVALWGNHPVETLPLTEVDFSALLPGSMPIRTFQAKWDTTSFAHDATKLVQPTDLAPALRHRIEQVARATYRVFGLRDYGRVDLRLRDHTPMVIDVNANPDITFESTFLVAAQFGGYDYPAMLDRIVRIALARASSRR